MKARALNILPLTSSSCIVNEDIKYLKSFYIETGITISNNRENLYILFYVCIIM